VTVKIITDCTSDISPKLAQDLGITIVPLYVHFGTEIYRDGVDLSHEDFYRMLASSKSLPTTSTIAPGEFAHIYDSLAKQTDEILAILISSELSATYEAAVQGKELMESKHCRVEIIDSRYVVMALGLIVIEAAKAALNGVNIDEIIDIVGKTIPRIHVRMAFDTLEYVKRGGRIGLAQALIGTLLQFKPILTIKDGVTTPIGRERTRAKAIQHLLKFASDFSNIKEMAIEYTTTPSEANILAQQLDSLFPSERTIISSIGSVMGTHLGPGALGVSILLNE
jgi:DegV family protein with EDD domain